MKKFYSLFLSFVLSVCITTSLPTIGYATSNFAGGSGTAEDPYLIETKEQLDNVRNDLNAHYKMIANIEFSQKDFSSTGAFYNWGDGWEPIGSSSNGFKGLFDGNGYTIKNLYININSASVVYAGLFGYNNGTIKNLGMINCDITAKNSDKSATMAGSIAGESNGRIINCYNTGNVIAISPYIAYAGGIVGTGFNVDKCYNTGKINSIASSTNYSATCCRAYAGGIIGRGGPVSICYNSGNIEASAKSTYSSVPAEVRAGGISGQGLTTISDCFNLGTITSITSLDATTGGICGLSSGDISNCYNVGKIVTSATSKNGNVYTGGIVGNVSSGIIMSCYYLNSIAAGEGFGTDSCVKCTACEMLKQSTYTDFDFNTIWEIDKNKDYPFPTLQAIDVLIDPEDLVTNGHTSSKWIIDTQATTSAPGSKHKECTVCGEVLETATIPQLKPATPKATTTNEIGGVNVTWNKVDGATKYVVYRRQGGYNTWVNVGTTTGNTLLDKNVKSGIYYVYSVRAYNNAGQYSDFVSANTQTRKYMATPKLTTIYNHVNGLAIKWNAVAGITNGYRVYRRGAGSTYWTYLGTTKNLYFIDSQVKNKSGEYFRYTVIADGGYHSKFDTTGLYLRRLANPTLTSAVSSKSGITVKWGAVKGTTGYYVYRKTANSTWTRVGTVGGTNNTTFLDKTAKKGTTYTYTVKAVYGATTSGYYSGISCKDKY